MAHGGAITHGGGQTRCVGAFDEGVSDVRFLGGTTPRGSLAAACWDSNVHVFIASDDDEGRRLAFETGGPVLGCETVDEGRGVVSASLDASVTKHDLETGSRTTIGSHGVSGAVGSTGDIAFGASAVRAARFSSPHVLASGGWDGRLKLWDSRCAGATVGHEAAVEAQLPGKCYGLDVAAGGNHIVAVTNGRKLASYDVRSGIIAALDQIGPSVSLPYQPRCVRISPDGRSQAIAYLEGKVTIEQTATQKAPGKPFTFKCHRKANAVFPVNAVAFSPLNNALVFTGGSDGFVNAWDISARKKIFQFAKFASSVSAIDINDTGDAIAVASSYAFEQGDVSDAGPNQVFVRSLDEPEFVAGR